MELTSLGYRTDLALLQLGGTQVVDRGDHLVVRSPHNPAFWWGNFLLLDRVPGPDAGAVWLDRFAAAFPDSDHVAIGFDGADGEVADLAWFAEHGFTTEAQTVMTAGAVHGPARGNANAVCRTLDTDGDWAQSVELQVRCNDRVEPVSYRTFATAKVQTNRGLSRFQSVETDPGSRRQGLASALVHHAGRYGFDTLRADTLVMVADPDYFAVDLYRKLGFASTQTQLLAERPPSG